MEFILYYYYSMFEFILYYYYSIFFNLFYNGKLLISNFKPMVNVIAYNNPLLFTYYISIFKTLT